MYPSLKIFYFVSICAIIGVICYVFNEIAPPAPSYTLPKKRKHPYNSTIKMKYKDIKYILYWMPFWKRNDYFIGEGFEPFEECEFTNCYATSNRNFLMMESYDALLFHAIYEKDSVNIPEVRKPYQYYIYVNDEPPGHITPNLKPYNSFFNWTMTYRFDSDIVKRYGVVVEMETDYKFPSEDFLNNKTKLAAWFVSHCETMGKREVLVKEILKFTKVDIYGECGTLSCKHKEGSILSSEECYDMVEREYKFYFSFENSYCKDYSTEKLYSILRRNIVPVVYGGGNYVSMAPPNSVINVEDFKNVSHLVSYLEYLDKNNEKYLEYFKWKEHYIISSRSMGCQICAKLNEEKKSVYNDLYSWWWGLEESLCKLDKDLPKIVSNLLS